METRDINQLLNIDEIIIIGDSLSDRGTFGRRKFLFFSMNQIFGLNKISPLGRFTNGLSWADQFSANVMTQLIIDHFKREGYSKDDIVDGILHNEPYISSYIQKSFNLNDDKCIQFFSKNLIRTYCEGGTTADKYSRTIFDTELLAVRSFIACLEKDRDKLYKDNENLHITGDQKKRTLILDWTGANDLITANKIPTFELAKRAIEARVDSIEDLIKNGYRNFILFNLPDLSLTPRYQSLKHSKDQKNSLTTEVHYISKFFNNKLHAYCADLKEKYPECNIEIFDINKIFNNIYENPEIYGFDSTLRTKAYVQAPSYSKHSAKNSQSSKYLFWDDVHPTAALHAQLANDFFKKFMKTFHLEVTEEKSSQSESKINHKAGIVFGSNQK